MMTVKWTQCDIVIGDRWEDNVNETQWGVERFRVNGERRVDHQRPITKAVNCERQCTNFAKKSRDEAEKKGKRSLEERERTIE